VSFVPRIEFGTTEFEAEVLTTTHPRLLLGFLCREPEIKGPSSLCTTLQHELVFGRGYESLSPYTVLESSTPRKDPHNLVTRSRSNGLPSHDFRVMLHANKTPDSSVSTVTRLRWHDRGSGVISRW
jgi:hypothetical protein